MHAHDLRSISRRAPGVLAAVLASTSWAPTAALAEPAGAREPSAPDGDDTLDRPWSLAPIAVEHPQVFNAPTARLLPAGVVYAGIGLDSDATPSASAAIGLGDVAEFGVGFVDIMRARASADGDPDELAPYLTATFKMGVPEELVFRHQPAVVLGFRKSFEHSADDFDSRVAELFLITSKRLGSATQLHVGATLWDASLTYTGGETDSEPALLHDRGVARQLRGILGFDARVKPRALVMIETYWAPELRYDTRRIALTAKFAFGVRYELTDWIVIESGVAVPDIEARDLLQAKIFGRLRFIDRRLARAYRRSL